MCEQYIPLITAGLALFGTIFTCATAIYVARFINKNLKKYETVFAYLHKRRAEVIEDLHKRLVEIEDHLDKLQNIHLAGDINAMNKWRTDSIECTDAFLKEFWNTRLFLTKEFCEKIDKDFLPSARDYLQKVEAYTLDKTANTSQEREQLRDISRTFVTVLRPILRELESMIRSMMGND